MLTHRQHIKTFARIKPLFNNEDKVFDRKNQCTVISKNNDEFGFDCVFGQNSTNFEVYQQTAKDVLQNSFQGYNTCILAYGQTSSGKTYTMKGSQKNPGIIPLCLQDIFRKIEQQHLSVEIKISYIEIYNQDVLDLLSDRQKAIVDIKEDARKNIILNNLEEFIIQNTDKAIREKGQEKRKFASNTVNNMSSRSHTIFRISLQIITGEDFKSTLSQINLVDLAGSQSLQKTKGEKISKTEGQNINKSILALTKVIRAMSEKPMNSQGYHINYRDSKLTRILQKSLCQNSKSTIICMINPKQPNYQQCMNTLKFGQMAAKIKIQARQNLIQAEEKRIKNQMMEIQMLPTERMELQKIRAENMQQDKKIEQLIRQNQQLQTQVFNKDTQIFNVQNYLTKKMKDADQMKQNLGKQNQQLWRKMDLLQVRLSRYEQEIYNLERINDQLRIDKRNLERNQKGLAESLQQYENQCKSLNNDLTKIRNKIDEENSKSKRTSEIKEKEKPRRSNEEQNRNLFYLAPYDENQERLPINRLASIFNLKAQVIDLGRQVNSLNKANAELVDEVEEYKLVIKEYQIKEQKGTASSKINPEVLDINQIRKLNSKIKNLKAQLKTSKEREKKYREIIKKDAGEYLTQMEQYQEWFNQKYVQRDHLKQKQTQTEFRVDSILLQSIKSQIPDSLKLHLQNNYSNQSESMNIFPVKKQTSLNPNPEQKQKIMQQSTKKIIYQSKPYPDENIDINIDNNFSQNQFSRKSFDLLSNDMLLLDNSVQPNKSNVRNFVNFDENARSKRFMQNDCQESQKNGSKKMRIQNSFFPSNPTKPNRMMTESERQFQI